MADSASGSSALWVALGSLTIALLGVAGAWYWARRWWAERSALQRSRSERQVLSNLLDVWQWRTDAQHRLIHWQAPAGSPPSHLTLVQQQPRLWEFLQSDGAEPSALSTLMAQHQPLPSLPMLRPATLEGGGSACQIQGAPVLDDRGEFCGYVGTVRDVHKADRTLAHELLDALPTPALLVTLPGGDRLPTLSDFNAAAQQWLGTAPPAGEPALTWSEVLQHLPALLRPAVEHAVRHPDAPPLAPVDGWSLRVIQSPPEPPHAARGVPALWLIFQRESRQASAGTAGYSAQQDDQESFSYTVSHDLRAPIRVVEGFTKIVKEDYGRLLDRVGNDHLDRVLSAASRMNSMIDALLALSQLSSRPLSRQPVNLSQLAGYIVEDLRRQSPERELQVTIEPGLIAHGDATLLRVVLENLLGNAWKYTSKSRQARIWFESSVHEGRPAFTVRDNGAGFDMRFADRLFGVFQRLHSANDFQGTGVGLASVRRILRRHGGDIWAEGEVDRGARFQFWIQD